MLIAVHGIAGFLLIMYPLLRLLQTVTSLGAAILREKTGAAEEPNLSQLVFLGLGLGLLGELVCGFFEYTFFVRQVETAFWMVCGILYALTVSIRRELAYAHPDTLPNSS
jgi:hypothetical protein